MASTKEHIMDVAEKLFADQGIGATSLRSIIESADVNAAAIAYHFGSKDDLIHAILTRRLGPLNQERLKMLDEIEAKSGKTPAPPDHVLEAFIAPALRLVSDDSPGGSHFIRFLGRLYGEAGKQSQELLQQHFGELLSRFFLALKRSQPSLSEKKFTWRFYFLVGALAYTMVDRSLVEGISKGRFSANETETAIRELVAFTAAGLNGDAAKRDRK